MGLIVQRERPRPKPDNLFNIFGSSCIVADRPARTDPIDCRDRSLGATIIRNEAHLFQKPGDDNQIVARETFYGFQKIGSASARNFGKFVSTMCAVKTHMKPPDSL